LTQTVAPTWVAHGPAAEPSQRAGFFQAGVEVLELEA